LASPAEKGAGSIANNMAYLSYIFVDLKTKNQRLLVVL